jgi:pimeloyl-ACP methyl ester carboxylesterase
MAEITHRTIQTNGIKMHIAEAGEGPLVLMVHGFPESWYSWRHQLPALAAAGFHAVAPDVRGYGRTDAPEPIEAYSTKQISADLAGVLDALGENTAVMVGHDFGAPAAYTSALLYPDRFRAVIGMSVPYTGRAPMAPMQLFKAMFQDNFFYILYFQEPGVAEAELETDVRRSLRLFRYVASGDLPEGTAFAVKKADSTFLEGMPEPEKPLSWTTEADLDYYVAEYVRTGFRGGLNRYRNLDRDFEELAQLQGAKIQQPSLYITGERDAVIAMNPPGIETMKQNTVDLRKVVLLPGCGHWTQQERPDEVNAEMIAFLKGL